VSTRDPSTFGKIERDPDVCGGAWRIAGTRITSEQVARMVRDHGEAFVLREFPTLVEADLRSVWPRGVHSPLDLCNLFSRCYTCEAYWKADRTGIYGADLWCAAFMVAAEVAA